MPRDQVNSALLARARSVSFTPGRRDLAPLLDIVMRGEDDDARAAGRALERRPDVATAAALARLTGEDGAVDRGRARLARLLGRLAAGASPDDRAAAAAALAALLADPSAQVRRQAALAAGRLGGDAPVDALLARWTAEADTPVRRALAEALGKVGGAAGAAALAAAPGPGGAEDPALGQVVERARLTAARTAGRDAPSSIDPDAAPPAPLPVVLRCRAGLEDLLADELREAGFAPGEVGPGRVATVLERPLSALYTVRLHHGLGFPLAPVAGDPVAAVTAALTSGDARAILAAFTRGAIRYRLSWAGGGHRRAAVWRIAAEASARRPELINDPTRSTWQVRVHEGAGPAGRLRLELEPRGLPDPRFAYRVADVPAASHPTIAAALARLAVLHAAGPAADRVWDPFCGSGLELVERARLAPVAGLLGTDDDDAALAAARRNLESAGVTASLLRADALTHDPGPVTSIITNPPMGRRVLRGEVEPLLLRFVDRAAALLAPGGTLAWISPVPAATRDRAARAGMRLELARTIDMGGFNAELQLLRR